MPNTHRWPVLAGLLVFPVSAILHHLVFYRPTCMLNPFGPDYDWRTLGAWLSSDPSPYLGVVAAAIVYLLGRNCPVVQRATVAFLVGFAPLALWIWDIPGTGRTICHHFHDGRAGIHTRHLYFLGTAVTLCLLAWQQKRAPRRTSNPTTVAGAH